MKKEQIIIIALIVALIYLYYQNRKLAQLPATTQTIFELDERKAFAKDDEEKEDLIADKDAAIRSKNETEQELISVSNKLKNKQQEVSRKESEIERLKKEKSQTEISLNKKVTEKNGLITTLQREVNQLKEKYSKQGQLLDEEQLANNKLTEKIANLEEENKHLKKDSE